MKDFFISYNGKDKPWAEWIAWTLEEAGYEVVIQAWDFRPGGNFVMEMQKAATGTERTIAVLSDNYLNAEYTQPEWAAA
ncbi:MAG: toll/interleukin-1 receptor domain-containing protein, partial [Candidatus Poribacteria bacterium]|nr:toll/interleukin-1 receptor domain-containing protein [Candidatus Poribacteria bacterium]